MLAVLDGGTYYHAETLYGPRYAGIFDRILYAPDLDEQSLKDVRLLIVPDRTCPRILRQKHHLILAVAERGDTVVVLGENEAHDWVPGMHWLPRPTNFWWWLEPHAVAPHRLVTPEHELFQFLNLKDCIWHFHGVLRPLEGVISLIDVPPDENGEPGGVLLYDDRISTPGRLIVSTLDPFYHHGSHFMPATTRFLDRFLPWAKAEAHTRRES